MKKSILSCLTFRGQQLTIGLYKGDTSFLTTTITDLRLKMETHGDLSDHLEGSIGDLSVVSSKEGLWQNILKFSTKNKETSDANVEHSTVVKFAVDVHRIPKKTEKYPGYDIALCKFSFFLL